MCLIPSNRFPPATIGMGQAKDQTSLRDYNTKYAEQCLCEVLLSICCHRTRELQKQEAEIQF